MNEQGYNCKDFTVKEMNDFLERKEEKLKYKEYKKSLLLPLRERVLKKEIQKDDSNSSVI